MKRTVLNLVESGFVIIDRVHLVHTHQELVDAESLGKEKVLFGGA